MQKAHSTRRRNILKSAADLPKFVAKPRCHIIGTDKWKEVPFWLPTSLVSKVGIPCSNQVGRILSDILSNKKVEQLKALSADKRLSVADVFFIAMLNYSQQYIHCDKGKNGVSWFVVHIYFIATLNYSQQ